MSSHSRSKSKGAFSILSIDTFRSFSRADSRQAVCSDDIIRSPSSLSCNPHDQPSASPEPQLQTSRTDLASITVTHPKPKDKRRTLSWLSLQGSRRHQRSMSVQLSNDNNSATMTRSVISAPILTSTTNATVAAQEGVLCGECVSTDEATASEARLLAEKNQAEEAQAYLENPRRRFVDILKDKLRRRDRTDFAKIDEELGISRRRTETVNLCKDKIKKLTGNGHVKRKSMSKSDKIAGVTHQRLSRKESQAALITSCFDTPAALEFDHTDTDSNFGSLTRSFNSALEKLDFQTTHIPRLRSRSSIFSMVRTVGGTTDGIPSLDPRKDPPTPRPGYSELNTNFALASNSHLQPVTSRIPGDAMLRTVVSGVPILPKKLKKTEPGVDGLAATAGVQQARQGSYSRGHPNGLSSHPFTNMMASEPKNDQAAHEQQRLMGRQAEHAAANQALRLSRNSVFLLDAQVLDTPDLTPTKSAKKESYKNKSLADIGGILKNSVSKVFKKDDTPPSVPTRTSTPLSMLPKTPANSSPLATDPRHQDPTKRIGQVFE